MGPEFRFSSCLKKANLNQKFNLGSLCGPKLVSTHASDKSKQIISTQASKNSHRVPKNVSSQSKNHKMNEDTNFPERQQKNMCGCVGGESPAEALNIGINVTEH